MTGDGGVPSGATAVTGNLTVTGQTSNGYLFIGPDRRPTTRPARRSTSRSVTTEPTRSPSPWQPAAPSRSPTCPDRRSARLTSSSTSPATSPPTRAAPPITRSPRPASSTPATAPAASRCHSARMRPGPSRSPATAACPSGATAVTGNLTVTGQTPQRLPVHRPDRRPTTRPARLSTSRSVTIGPTRSPSLSARRARHPLGHLRRLADRRPRPRSIFDVTGYFTADTERRQPTYPSTPTRILDTRNGTAALGCHSPSHAARTFQVTGNGGVPSDATAVTGNLTVTGQTSSGFLFIGPDPDQQPDQLDSQLPGRRRSGQRGHRRLSAAGGTLSVTLVSPTPGQHASRHLRRHRLLHAVGPPPTLSEIGAIA